MVLESLNQLRDVSPDGSGNFSPMRPLRIAQVAPLYESVPPRLYGGTERVVAFLSEALARRGHRVTLFASGDSSARVPLVSGYPMALRLGGVSDAGAALHLPMLSKAYDDPERFDIIHSHVDFWAFPLARLSPIPTISTLHGRLDEEASRRVYRHYPDVALVSISDSQRKPLPAMNWAATVYHGLPVDLLRFDSGGDYLAFIGRLAPEKRPDLAIEIARRAGLRLRIAAKVDPTDREYFASVVKPRLGTPGIEFIGEIDDTQKQAFLGHARALLFPIDWPEPFGLAMIEALACGTPVVARPCGSVPEIVNQGVTGLIASSVDDLVNAVRGVGGLSRQACRAEFERRFSDDVMAANYEQVYLKLMRTRLVRSWNGRAAEGVMTDSALSEQQAK